MRIVHIGLNASNTAGMKALSAFHPNLALRELYLDHTSQVKSAQAVASFLMKIAPKLEQLWIHDDFELTQSGSTLASLQWLQKNRVKSGLT
jgi:hypothetical protein